MVCSIGAPPSLYQRAPDSQSHQHKAEFQEKSISLQGMLMILSQIKLIKQRILPLKPLNCTILQLERGGPVSRSLTQTHTPNGGYYKTLRNAHHARVDKFFFPACEGGSAS